LEIIEKNIISEEELVTGCVADERQAQEMLYRRYADKMYNICLTYADNEDDACDLLQEGFIRVFRNLHRFRFESALEWWIRKIMVNAAIETYRKKRREKEVFADYQWSSQPVVEEVLGKINAGEVIQLVNQLPSKAAMVLKLYAIEGYKHKEIAKLMGVTVGTTKSQLNRARFLLKEEISKLNG